MRFTVWVAVFAVVGAEDQAALAACRLDLDGTWRLHVGALPDSGRIVSAPGFDDGGWIPASVPGTFESEFEASEGWLRWTAQLPECLLRGSTTAPALGLSLGKINSAYEVWAGGMRLGGVGRLPEHGTPRVDYDRHSVWHLPDRAVAADGMIVVALKIWTDPTLSGLSGPFEGEFAVGFFQELDRRAILVEVPALVIACLFFLLGLIHLELFRRRREHLAYWWFSLASGGFAVYAVLRSQWKYLFLEPVGFVILKEAEHVIAFLLVPIWVRLIWSMLDEPLGSWSKWAERICVALAVLIVVVPGMGLNQQLLPFWQILMFSQVVNAIRLISREALAGRRDALILAIGTALAAAMIFHDILLDRGLVGGIRIGTFGFGVYVAAVAFGLAGQFARRLQDAESTRRREEQLLRNEELAERANRAKSQFLANVSHEIRTPMTAILGAANLLLQDPTGDPAEVHDRIEIIHRSSTDLLHLIDEVLDYSKLEAGRLQEDPVDFELKPMLQAALRLFGPQADKNSNSMELRIEDDMPVTFFGDVNRIRQILLNLLSNAVKFTRGGSIIVRASARRIEADRWSLELLVRDTGIGIDADGLKSLFLPFTQVDASTSRHYGGTGLGLAISQSLAHLLGGEISVESEPGVGSRFTLSLPVREVAEDFRSARETHPRATPTRLGDDSAGDSLPAEVILAEDNEVNQLILAAQLRLLGLEVRLASDGFEVLRLLEERPVDLILMDCQMPGLDGYETTRRLRKSDSACSEVPIVAVTAHALEGEKERCLACGMDDYLAKPFPEQDLVEILAKWLPAARLPLRAASS